VSANVALDDPAGAKVVRVVSAVQLREAMLAAAAGADAVVMAAAVADFRPATYHDAKIKKTGAPPEPIVLTQNPDVLAELSARRGHQGQDQREDQHQHPVQDPGQHPVQIIVGFAAETEDLLLNGRAKLTRKGCDLLVVNQVGGGLAFGTSDNQAVVLGADGSVTDVPRGPKAVIADVVWDLVVARLPRS
jgi:phosphopantothenoylcysteine decarboxylase/phosphopantothenate--cysteine ligase